jgi:hypothetical protein
MTPHLAQRIREVTERCLTVEEARAYLDAPVHDEERAAVLDQVQWFTRRYPTPLERLAYVSRAWHRWTRRP